jgi:tetratricopeptide (TPR) repeat protein
MKSSCTATLICLLFLLCSINSTKAQNPQADSLKNVLRGDSTNTKLLLSISRALRNSLPEEAEKYALKALALSKKNNRPSATDSALYEVAGIAYIRGNLDLASQYLNERIELELKTTRDSVGLARSYGFLGGVLNELGKKVEALNIYLKGKIIVDKLADPKIKFMIYNNLGLYYHDDREKAMSYRLQAYEYSKLNTDYPLAYKNSSQIAGTLANDYVLKKDFAKARQFLNESLAYAAKINYVTMEAFVFGIYSEIFRLEKNYDSAVFYQLKNVNLKISIGEKSRLHDAYGLLGELYLEQDKYEKAIINLSKAVELTKEMKSLLFQYRWLPPLSRAYGSSGKYELAYKTMSEFHTISDSVMNEEKVKAIAEMEAKYELHKKESENQLLQKEQTIQQQINRQQKLIFSASVILIFIGGLAFYFRAKANKLMNIRLNEKLDAQNRELSTVALLVSKKNQAFSQVKTKLEEIAKESNGHSSTIKSVVKDIDQEMNFDEEWNTFKYHFEKVHPDFFVKLKEIAPTLSVTELRLCAYLQTNLSTKEIAKLTNTTIRSVQQAKYRVNQKFPSHSGNLPDYLAKI